MTFEDFLVFERDNACEKLQIDGFHYWWYIRYALIVQCGCLSNPKEGQAKNINKSWKHRITSLFQFIFAGLKHSPFRKGEKNSLFILQDAIFYNPEEAYYECPRTQPVMKYWNGKKTLISDYYTQYNANAFPYQFSETTFTVYPFVLAKVKGQLWKLLGYDKKIKREIAVSISPILSILKEQYHVSLELDLISMIYQQYLYWKEDYKYYERLIIRLKPYGIVESCYYSQRKMAFNEAAKKYHIPVIELQHGIMGERHQAYNSYIMENTTFPDYILVFSDYWKRCTRFPLPKEKVIAVGYPYLENQIQKSMGQRKKRDYQGRLLLVIGSADAVDKEMLKYLLEVCAYVKEREIKDFRIIYKMHPRFTDSYNKICDMFLAYKDILYVLKYDEKNLYDCFAIADELISVMSTGIYEGIAYGLKAWIYQSEKFQNRDMDLLCENGYASFVSRPEQLFEEKRRAERPADELWMENSKERLINVLCSILSQ